MSDTSKSTESRNKSSWGNPFRKMISMVTGRDSSTSSTISEGDRVVFRWTAACLNTTCPIFSKNPQFNMIYAPAPSLLMFTVVALSSENSMITTLQKLFELTDGDIDDIREMSMKLNDLRAPKSFYFFVRFLVDEQKTTTVSKELMTKSNDVANQQVFASIRPSRVIKFLDSLTFTPVTLPRPPLLTTNGYGSAGLNAKWVGKTRRAGLHRFASSYSKRKLEPYFEIRTSYKRMMIEQFEVIEVPFQMGQSYGSIIYLRPHYIGHLPYANHQISTDMLSTMTSELLAATWIQGRLLLPVFSTSCQHDLWKNLMRHGVQPDLGQSQKAPPMASLWHWASLSVGSEGISGMSGKKTTGTKRTASQKALETECRGRISGDSLYNIHKTYAVRLDSPFTYIVQIDTIPIFTGSYFGSPPPKSSDIFVNAPERIRHRRSGVKNRKKAVKETRKQKLLKKLKKSKDRQDEKDRKREEKDRKRSKTDRFSSATSSDSMTNSTTNSTTTTSMNSSSSNSIEQSKVSEPPEKIKKVEKKVESAEPKSKSSGWRKFAGRIFGKK